MYLGGIVSAGLLAFAVSVESKVVQTQSGAFQGGTCRTTDVNYFFSIPFAQPPVGELRLAPPEPYQNSSCNVIDATVPSPACIQFTTLFAEKGTQSEDCLYLNVWAPASATPESKLPVKVWVYGGTNEGGGVSDPTYNGCFSAVDSIIVSTNYRLGPLGFLALEDLGLSGNYALMDQLLALRWVHENVAAFGGDPEKVMLFGQSTGAANVFTLATLPEITGLAQAAALESGAGRDLVTVADAKVWFSQFVEALNCSTSDLSCLRSAEPSAFQTAASALPDPGVLTVNTALTFNGSRSAWVPVIDGNFIKEQPSAAGIKIPAIIGSNTEEGSIFVLAYYGNSAISGQLTQSDYDKFLAYNFGPLAGRVNETYSLASTFKGSVFNAVTTILTDVSYKCPTYRALVQAEKNGIPVWSYLFNHQPSCPWYANIKAEWLPILGVTHTSDIPFVFNFTSSMPPPDGNCTFTALEQSMSHTMSRAWTNMAELGSPDSQDVWPAWTSAESKGVVFEDAMDVGVVDYTSCAFWGEINTDLNEYWSQQH
ncbi:alpha/beta-hydrolase [Hypoxylon cercidicola]|nr:alpha/beta-hydrolase [Hypoxylon cercidicola]